MVISLGTLLRCLYNGAAHRFPIGPIIVLAPSQHQGGERAAQAKAEAAARPLVSCKAPVMCRPVRCLPYLVGGISCTLEQLGGESHKLPQSC